MGRERAFDFPAQFFAFFLRTCSNEERPVEQRVGLPSSPVALEAALVEGGGAGIDVRPSAVRSANIDSAMEGLGVTCGVRLSRSVSKLIGLGGTAGLFLHVRAVEQLIRWNPKRTMHSSHV